jgi:hypothetical protein
MEWHYWLIEPSEISRHTRHRWWPANDGSWRRDRLHRLFRGGYGYQSVSGFHSSGVDVRTRHLDAASTVIVIFVFGYSCPTP